MNMQCYSCHAIQSPRESLAAPAERVGPDFTSYSILPKKYLAKSIIKAHTVVATRGYSVKEGKATIANYHLCITIPGDDRFGDLFQSRN
jgi:hypothetical protein